MSTEANDQKLYGKIYGLIMGGKMKLSPRNLEKMQKNKVLAKNAQYFSISDGMGSPLGDSLLKVFNLGTRPQPRYHFTTHYAQKKLGKRFLLKVASSKHDRIGDKYPWLFDATLEQFMVHEDRSYTKHLMIRDVGLSALTPLSKQPEAHAKRMVGNLMGHVAKNASGTRGEPFYQSETYIQHMARVAKKYKIQQVKCMQTGALVAMEEALKVISIDPKGIEVPGEFYVRREVLDSSIRVGNLKSEKGSLYLEPDMTGKAPHVIEYGNFKKIQLAQYEDQPATGLLVNPARKLHAVAVGGQYCVVYNLPEFASVLFVKRKREGYQLTKEATLLNYTTETSASKKFSHDHIHRCGFEVEVSTAYSVETAPKLDGKILDPNDFFKYTGWAPSFDRSVAPGFELKSPIISFNNQADINAAIDPMVKGIIDSTHKGDNCGGHIHYSNANIAPEHLLRYMQRWAWLFAIIYPKRITNEYCEMTNGTPRKGSDHYRWVRLREGRIEIRIFPAFKKTTALAWRANLLAKLANCKPTSVRAAVNSFAEDQFQVATHVMAVRSQKELAENLSSQIVQNQLIHAMGVSTEDLKQIQTSLIATDPIE